MSVLGRVLLNEPDTAAIRHELGRFEQHISSRLLRVEAASPRVLKGMLEYIDELLSGKVLIPLDEEILAAAESIAPSVARTLDAIHLATAIRLTADAPHQPPSLADAP